MSEDTTTPQIPEPVKRRHVINANDAREQASEEFSFLRSEFRVVEVDGTKHEFEIPHKDLFDPDQQDRFDELIDSLHDYDREPDLTASDGTVIRRGDLIMPHRKNGRLVRPAWSERLGIVLWGKDGAALFRKGGGNFNEIEIVWGKQAREMRKWREADSKSPSSDSAMEAAAD